MPLHETTIETWFESASLHSQFAYVLACAIADRQQSHAFWSSCEPGSLEMRNPTLARDANATMHVMQRLQNALAKGEIVVDRIIPDTTERG